MAERFKFSGEVPPVATYFQAWRNWKGWTQQELADQLGTSKQTVSRIETGARDWSKGYLEGFAAVIGCPLTAPLLVAPHPGQSLERIQQLFDLLPALVDRDLREDAIDSLQSFARVSGRAPGRAAKARRRTTATTT